MTPENFARLRDFGRADTLAIATQVAVAGGELADIAWTHGIEQASSYGDGWGAAYATGAAVLLGESMKAVFGSHPELCTAWLCHLLRNADEVQDSEPAIAASVRVGTAMAVHGLKGVGILVDAEVERDADAFAADLLPTADTVLDAAVWVIVGLTDYVADEHGLTYLDAFVVIACPPGPFAVLAADRPVLEPPLADAG